MGPSAPSPPRNSNKEEAKDLGAAGKDGAPSAQPSMTGAGANRRWFVPDLGLGELTQERHGLLRFASKDHQTSAAVGSRRVRDLLPAPRASKGSTIHPRAQWTGLAVPPSQQTPWWCQSRVEPHGTKPRPLQVACAPRGGTLPPASWQTRAAALSRAKPQRPNTPETAQADQWWPKASSGRPHRQAEDRGRGHQRRRRNETQTHQT